MSTLGLLLILVGIAVIYLASTGRLQPLASNVGAALGVTR